jgi:hypothetical protein
MLTMSSLGKGYKPQHSCRYVKQSSTHDPSAKWKCDDGNNAHQSRQHAISLPQAPAKLVCELYVHWEKAISPSTAVDT